MAFGKLGQLLGFDDDDYEDDDYYDEEVEDEGKAKPSQVGESRPLSIGRNRMPDCVFAKPKSYDEIHVIADKIKERNVVVINFDAVTPPVAHRFIDFLSGIAYACEGQIKQVSKDAHIIVPVGCDYQDITAALEQEL